MAQKFNIVAQLQLQGPSNLSRVVSQIQSKLQNVNAQINFQINKNAAQNVQAASNAANNLSKSSAAATKQVSNLSKASRTAGNNAASSAKNFQQAASAAESFGKQSALAVKRFAAFTVSAGILGGFVAAMKNGVSAAIDFERELIKVSQVTGKSMDALSALTNQIAALSKGMGVASAELVNVSRILSQTGMTANEVRVSLKALAQSSLAPTFKDMTNTAEGAIAIMRQFGVTADQLGKKLGSINALAGSFAVESQDLIFAIRRAGGAFQAAGGQLEELLALFTSVRATTRESAETIATGFRTIFTRMQRPKTIEFLRATGVELHNLEGNFVGPFEAVKRLSKALKQLESTDPRFQKIIEELGGFRQVSKVIPLIQQFATAQRALTVAQQGQGSLARDAAKAQETLAVKVMKVREQFLGLFRDIAGSKTFKTFADLALNMASSFIKVGDALKPVLPLLATLAAFQGARMTTQFIGGFAKGMTGAGGGQGGSGARGAGGAVANRVTGQQSAANAVKHIQALTMNTQALTKLSTSLTTTNQQITKLTQSLTTLPKQLRLSLGGAGGTGRRPFASGGVVPGSGNRDTVPAMLTPGEFVIRKSSVKKYGAENLQKMNTGGKKLGDVSRGRRLSGGAKGASYAGRRSKRFGKRMRGGQGKAYAFDFDDTLAESDAVVREGADDPYEDFRGKKGASFVRSARATKIASMAQRRASRGHDIYVVTARPNDRSTRTSIGHFMRGVGAPAKDVIGVGGTPGPGGTSQKKAQVLARLKKRYADITFLDDDMDNVLAAAQVSGVKSIRAKKFSGGRIQRMATGGKKKKSLPKQMNLIGPQRRIGGFFAKPSAGSSTQTYTDKTGFPIKPGRQGAGEQGKIADGQFPILAPVYNPSANDKGMPKGTTLAAAIQDGAVFGVRQALRKAMRNLRTKNVLPNMGKAKLNPKASPAILAEAETDKQVAPTLGGYTYEGVIRSLTGVMAGKGLNPNFDIEDTTGYEDKLAGIFGPQARSIQTAEVKLDKSKFGKADSGIIAKMKSDYNTKQFATTYLGKGPSKPMGHIGMASKIPATHPAAQKKAMGGLIQKMTTGGKKKPFRFFQNFSKKPIKKDGGKGKGKEKQKRDFSGSEIAIRGGVITARYAKGSGKSGLVTAGKMFGNTWEVNSSQATKGFGPHLYDLVMEGVTSKGGMLVSDRASVSADAKRVWDYYYSKRPDVQKKQLHPNDWPINIDLDKFPSEDQSSWPPKTDVASWSLKHGYMKTPNLLNKPNVKKMAKGGAATDTVPALLTPGEFVINKSSAQRVGYGKLHKINTGRAPVQGFAKGGLVQKLHTGGKPGDLGGPSKMRRGNPDGIYVPGIGYIMPDDPNYPDMGGLDVGEGGGTPAAPKPKPKPQPKTSKPSSTRKRKAAAGGGGAPPTPPDEGGGGGLFGKLINAVKENTSIIHKNAKGWMKDRKREVVQKQANIKAGIEDTAGRGTKAARGVGKFAMDAVAKTVVTAGKLGRGAGDKIAGGVDLARHAAKDMGQDWGGLAMQAGKGVAGAAGKVGGAALAANRAVGDTMEAAVAKSLEGAMKGLTKVVTVSVKGTKDLGTKISNGAKATKEMASKLKEGAKSVASDVGNLGMRQYEQDFGSDIKNKDTFYADAAKKGRGKREALVRHAQEKRDKSRENVSQFSGVGGAMGRRSKQTAGAENVLATQRKGLKGALAGLDEKARDRGSVLIAKAFDKAEAVGKKLVAGGKKSIANIKDNIKTLKQNIASRKQSRQNAKRNAAQFGGMGGGMGAQAQKTAAANQGMFGRMRSRVGGMFGGGRRGGGGGAGAAAGGAGQGGGGGGGGGGGMGDGMGAGMKLQMAMMLAANATQVLGQMFGKMPPGLEKLIGSVNQAIITFTILKQTLAMVGGMGKAGGMLSKLQGPVGGIIAAFVSLGMVVKSFGDDMKSAAVEKAKEAKTEAEAAEAVKEYQKGQTVGAAGTGMAVGGGIGLLWRSSWFGYSWSWNRHRGSGWRSR